MESEKSATKRSFFREYFFYKLRVTLGIAITSAVLGFISCVLSGIFVLMMLKMIEDEVKGNSGIYSEPNVSVAVFVVMLGLAGMTVLAIVTPIVTFKFYRSRSSMDTMGCLPITYGQRFWGDFLSGLAALAVPFSAMGGIGGILLVTAQQKLDRLCDELQNVPYYISNMNLNVSELGMKFYLVMLIVIVAAYAVAVLVTSCCGKAGSAALYSIIALPIIPAVVGMFGTFLLNCAVGIIPEEYINKVLSCIPPIGSVISVFSDAGASSSNGEFTVTMLENPLFSAIALIFIAAITAGAYLIGKHRKTERVGSGFVVNVMYHILTLMLVLAVIGVYGTANRILGLDFTKILIGVAVTLVFYLILEFVQYRNFKTIWKSLIRYACVAVVGFGFLIICIKSEGFGFGKKLPNQSDIEEIRMTGFPFGEYYSNRGFKYRAENAITAILAEHQRLLNDSDMIFTGNPASVMENEIHFTYELKSGEIVSRYYRVNDAELFSDVVAKIKQQPVYEVEALGALNRIDLGNVKVNFKSDGSLGIAKMYIRSSKIPELVEMLKYDLINYVKSGDNSENVGYLDFNYLDGNGNSDYNYLAIRKGYTRTVEFLKNPDNFTDESENPEKPGEELEYYDVNYNPDHYTAESDAEAAPDESDYMISSAGVTFRSDSDSEYAKELMSYFSKESESNREDKKFRVLTFDENHYFAGETYFIPEDKETAALKALMNLIAEQAELLQ